MATETVLDPRPKNLNLFTKPLIILTDPEELDTQILVDVLRRLGEQSLLDLRNEIKENGFKFGDVFFASQAKGTVIYVPLHASRVSQISLNKALRMVDEELGQESAYLVYPWQVNRRELTHMIRESAALIEVILVRDKLDHTVV